MSRRLAAALAACLLAGASPAAAAPPDPEVAPAPAAAPAPDPGADLDALVAEGRAQLTAGDPAAAEATLARAVALREAEVGGHPAGLPAARAVHAQALQALARYAEAEAAYLAALAGFEALGDEATAGIVLNNLASLYDAMGQPARSEAPLRRALEIAERTRGPDDPGTAISRVNLGALYESLGRYQEAIPPILAGLATLEKVRGPDHPHVAEALDILAAAEASDGRLVEAEQHLLRALAIREKALGPTHPSVAVSANNLAQHYLERGDTPRAEVHMRRAADLLEAVLGPRHPMVATVWSNLGAIVEDLGRAEEAEGLYRRALALREEVLGPEHPSVAISLNNLAYLETGRGGFEAAEALYRRALAIQEKAQGPDHPTLASILANLGQVLWRLARPEEAATVLARALAIREKALSPGHPALAMARLQLASANLAAGRPDEAMAGFARGLDEQEAHLRRVLTVGGEEERRLFLQDIQRSTDRLVHEAVRSGDARLVRLTVTTLLRRQGRTLDGLRDAWRGLRERLDDEGRRDLDALAAARRELSALTLQPPGADPEAARARREALATRAAELEASLSRRSAAFAEESAVLDADTVAAALGEGEVLVGFAIYPPSRDPGAAWSKEDLPRRVLGYALAGDGSLAWKDLGEAGPLEGSVAAFREAVGSRDPAVKARARDLYDRVLAPLQGALAGAGGLVVAPDGALNLVPFPALAGPDGRWLAETHAVRYVTSARELLAGPARAPRQGPLVLGDAAFGKAGAGAGEGRGAAGTGDADRGTRSGDLRDLAFDPLPGTRAEAMALQRTLGLPRGRVHLGRDASESVLTSAHGPSVLHVATHGFFLPPQAAAGAAAPAGGEEAIAARRLENPLLRSGLALAGFNARRGGGGHDGVVTALELADLDLDGTELVVLSACETGLGKVDRGEGVYGLSRALALAGARTRVTSLWKVSDAATQALMTAWYRRLAAGEDRVEALRAVQLAMARGELAPGDATAGAADRGGRRVGGPGPAAALDGWRHPYFWASFGASGAAGPLDPAALGGVATPSRR